MSRMLALTIVFVSVSTFVLLEFASAANLRSRLPPREYEIHEGNCTGEKLVDEDIIKEATPRTTQNFRYGWDGANVYFVTCINVDNNMNKSDGGLVRIRSGGLGQSKAELDILSKNGKEINFHFELYAEFQDPEFTTENSTILP